MNYYFWIAAFILGSVLVGLVRVFRGPTGADRMLAAQLFGTGGVALLLILARAMQLPALLDVALVYALLAATANVVFVRRQWRTDESTEEKTDEHS
jgi:multicomponent Na+:H+ antiporter subunit F